MQIRFLKISVAIAVLSLAGCGSAPEDDATKLSKIIDKYNGKINREDACKEAGFDTDRCLKADEKMTNDAINNGINRANGN
jgi:hypothetical protein